VGDVPLLLRGDDEGELRLYEGRDGTWSESALPKTRFARLHDLSIAKSDGAVAVYAYECVLVREAGAWRELVFEEPPGRIDRKRYNDSWAHARRGWRRNFIGLPKPEHLVVAGDRLWLGFDFGEWGGSLLELDLATGRWMLPPVGESQLPVSDLEVDRSSRLWCVRGIGHLTMLRGGLWLHDEEQWVEVCSTEGTNSIPSVVDADGMLVVDRAQPRPLGDNRGDWNLPAGAFESMAFDEWDRAYLLARRVGLVRRDVGTGWSVLTPSVDGGDLMVRRRTAVVGDARGLWILPLDGRAARHVAFE
jgi:hypothetical protein